MTIKKIRNIRGIAQNLSEAYGNSVSFYLKPMMKKTKVKIQAEKNMINILKQQTA